MTQRRVVVGYDGSQSAELALRWAAERAIQHRLPLELVHAQSIWPYDARGMGASGAPHDLVDAAVKRLLTEHSYLDVTTCVDSAAPAALLLGRADGAESLFVGARGHGGFPSLRLGSVGGQVAAHAHCPVVVVREPHGARSGTVVGVDASSSSDHAIAFAFDQAATHDEELTAVHAWVPFYAGLGDLPFYDEVRPADDSEAALLSEHLAGWREKYPEVRVRELVRSAHPVAALLDQSDRARLLVVGSHGRGGFAGMLLGSVSRSVLHHASCTVAVIRPYRDERR